MSLKKIDFNLGDLSNDDWVYPLNSEQQSYSMVGWLKEDFNDYIQDTKIYKIIKLFNYHHITNTKSFLIFKENGNIICYEIIGRQAPFNLKHIDKVYKKLGSYEKTLKFLIL